MKIVVKVISVAIDSTALGMVLLNVGRMISRHSVGRYLVVYFSQFGGSWKRWVELK